MRFFLVTTLAQYWFTALHTAERNLNVEFMFMLNVANFPLAYPHLHPCGGYISTVRSLASSLNLRKIFCWMLNIMKSYWEIIFRKQQQIYDMFQFIALSFSFILFPHPLPPKKKNGKRRKEKSIGDGNSRPYFIGLCSNA